jgi:hypothetical protein
MASARFSCRRSDSPIASSSTKEVALDLERVDLAESVLAPPGPIMWTSRCR